MECGLPLSSSTGHDDVMLLTVTFLDVLKLWWGYVLSGLLDHPPVPSEALHLTH